MANKFSRRSFLQKSATAAIGLTVVPSIVMGSKLGHVAPSDKLNIAGVGVGHALHGDRRITADRHRADPDLARHAPRD